MVLAPTSKTISTVRGAKGEKMRIKLDGTIISPIIDFGPIRHGHWVNHISENGATDGTYCSICDYEINRDARYNYCPNCGAKMDEKGS